ncbi:hypothetical protein ABIB42_003266 [Massilia sp. UYP32]|jgi:hypothetical protein|uniref:hypothetical protein n=1 Tax=Massilia TaxID=149698 RepID=UPI0012F82769|nr:hypothetical protein [Massilia timonae]
MPVLVGPVVPAEVVWSIIWLLQSRNFTFSLNVTKMTQARAAMAEPLPFVQKARQSRPNRPPRMLAAWNEVLYFDIYRRSENHTLFVEGMVRCRSASPSILAAGQR